MAQETQQKLLQATRSLIDEEGLEAVTLRAVGARAGLSRGAAYRHFGDKEGLLAAIACEDFKELIHRFERIEALSTNPTETLRALLLQFHEFGLSSSVHYQLIFITPWDIERFPELHQAGKQVFDRAHTAVFNYLRLFGMNETTALSRTAIAYSFIHGLIELHIAGHASDTKGLGDTDKLVDDFLALLAGN